MLKLSNVTGMANLLLSKPILLVLLCLVREVTLASFADYNYLFPDFDIMLSIFISCASV
jgi:hypothetical protein